jgi:tol-pal system protein YbgF
VAALKARMVRPILLFVLSWGLAFADIRDDYQAAYKDYPENCDLAISGFQDFLANYPDSEYSDDATLYLGICYEAEKRYEQAIQTFDQLVERYPKSQAAPIALYMKASILEKLERHEEASDAWMKLMDLYPNSPQAIERRKLPGTDPPEPRPQSPTRPSV